MQNISPKNAIETYFAMAVHDLKTPVNAQILATEYLLKTGAIAEAGEELVVNILDSAKYLKNLIDNILTKYQLEINAINLNIEENSLREVVNEAVNGVKYLLEEKNIELILKYDVKNSVQKFDYIEIRRVINNLLANAIEYSPIDNKVILKICEKKNSINFSVEDFGFGINLKNPSDIFKKDLTLAKAQKKLGTGLGLFISKQIVEAHQGEIKVRTKLNKGTTISFTLPKFL